ncbi:MAG: hypothetical protein ACI956_000129 [Nonlabens sp.]|jgi:hypothetical protein
MINTTTLCQKLLCICLAFIFSNNIQAQIFWEETFTDSVAVFPEGWTTFDNNAGGGVWEVTNVGPTGAYAAPDDGWQIADTDNHWIMFDSDSDCSGDQDAWIVTSAIDCSDKEGVWLRFNQYYLNFYCETYVRITTNEATPLADWEEIQLNIASVNEEGPPEILMNISDYVALEDTVYIGFEFRNVAGQSPAPNLDGCGYNWQIDSIQLLDENPVPDNDLAIYNNFFAIAPNVLWPASQMEPFGFMADVVNNGKVDQAGVEIGLEIKELVSGTVAYTEMLSLTDIGFPSIGENEVVENQLFTNAGFLPDGTEIRYEGTYTITSDSTDALPEDNIGTFGFGVTSSVFAKEDSATISVVPNSDSWPEEAPFSWSFGNHYYVPNGEGWYADEAIFALGNPSSVAGKKVRAVLYEWDNIMVGLPTLVAPTDRTIIASNEYTITGFEGNGNLVTMDLLNANSEKGVALGNEGHYILMLSYETTDRTTPVAIAGNQERDFAAQIYRSEQLGEPRYGPILMIGELTGGTFNTVGFGRDVVPTIRMHITDEHVAVKTALSDINKIDLFPNPVKDKLNIHMEMASLEEQLSISIIDASGKIYQTKDLSQVLKTELQLEVSNLPAGNYFLSVDSTEGQRSLPFVVHR